VDVQPRRIRALPAAADEVEECALFDHGWILTGSGLKAQGVVGLMVCQGLSHEP
jgi:hypothetical protein